MEEATPPWVKYPNYPPGDTFWRQSGEIYLHYVWRPYWDSLKSEQQGVYLKKWDVPDVWQKFYFDEEFQKWLESTDDD